MLIPLRSRNSACVLDEHVWVFGDDHFDRLTGEQHGPHSSAIIIGASVVLTTAHSLCFEPDTSKRSKTKVCYYKHAEVYWVQKTITKDASGAFTTEDRVPVRLFKFSTVNDWAVLVRTDGKTFAGGARVHEEPTPFTSTRFLRANATLLHCPVSLIANLRAAGEYSLHVNANAVSLQQCSTHHVQYDDVSYRGSSGGALHVEGVDGVFGMHTTLWTECEYGDEDGVDIDSVDEYGVRHVFARSTPKLSGSESNSYPELPPPKKAKKDCDSESVVSRLAGGNNGQGRALVISQFPRLMFYLKAAAEEAAAEVAAAEVDVDADAAV